jgi:Family of unknown function (DUF5335)
MGATPRKLQAEQWMEYFDSIPVDHCPVLASVQVMSERTSDERNGSRRRLHAIGYDQHRDLLEVAVGFSRSGDSPLRYLITAPRSVDVAESDGTTTITVEDASGAQTLISLFNVGPVSTTATRSASRVWPPASHNGRPWRF